MRIHKSVAISASTLLLAANLTPILADDISVMQNDNVIQVCSDEINASSDVIHSVIDGIEIEKEDLVQQVPYNEVTYTYMELMYTDDSVNDVPQTISVDDFMALYGQTMEEEEQSNTEVVPVDTSAQEAAYQQALANYNSALAEYEAASQMIETTKEVEVEITEEVTDEDGNDTELTRTEIQTITEMIPAGDIASSQINLDTAKNELDNAQALLDIVENTAPIEETSVEAETEYAENISIDEQVTVEEVMSYAQSGKCGDNLFWNLNNNGLLTISGSGLMYDYTSDSSSPWGTSVNSVTIDNGVTSIGSYAFFCCKFLTSVSIPNSVTNIGCNAFWYCQNLTSVAIPSSVIRIEHDAFHGCNSLSSIQIADGVTEIGNDAFFNCSSLTSIQIPDSVTSIGIDAFGNCTSLISIAIPDSVTYIGFDAFSGTPYIKNYANDLIVLGNGILYKYKGSESEVIIPNNVTSIGEYAFSDHTGFNFNTTLNNVKIPNSVTSIGHHAFYRCTGLYFVTIPGSVTSIGYDAFLGCSNLSDITIPDSVMTIGYDAFSETPFIENYVEDFIVLGNGILHKYKGTDSEVIIPNSVTSIGSGAFKRCSSVKRITIPNSVTSIGDRAFVECSSLTGITIPNSVTSIGSNAFSLCKGLTSITVPDSVTNIGSDAFSSCTLLTSVHYKGTKSEWEEKELYDFGENVTLIFDNTCGDNLKWTLDNDGLLTISGKGPMYDYNSYTSSPWGKHIECVVIGDGVTSIGSGAFYKCTDLTSITISDSVTSIGESALEGCSSLTSLTLPNSVTSIGCNAFSSCRGLTSIMIPDSVTSIGYSAFEDCILLHSVTIPNSVTSIGYSAFYSTYLKTAGPIGSGCDYEFGWTDQIPDNAFRSCNSLTSITIPDGVTSIGSRAFARCSSLTRITIPESVTYVGDSAFNDCSRLSDVYFQGMEEQWNQKNLYRFDETVTIHFLEIPFTDVPADSWYYSTVKECYETGLINGTSPTTFSPMQTMTRAMVVTILWRMDGQPKTDFNNKFKDVSSSQWYATSISWAANNGVVNGYGDGTFKPDAAVTREQVAVMLANYAGYKKVYKPGTKKLNTYPDGSQVSTWAQSGMKWALTNGIISGDGAGYLRPKKSATRAEGAAMLLRMNNWL